MHFDRTDIDTLEQRYRGNLINCLSGFKPAVLVGTKSTEGQTNLAIFSNLLHLGANPALLGLLVRPAPAGTERHTWENIVATQHFTVNHVNEAIVPQAHQTSARYPRETSEFSATGLTPEWLADYPAPFVAEATVKLGLRLIDQHHFDINHTTLLIGEVQTIHLPSEILREDGSLDLTQEHAVAACGLDSYHTTGTGCRYRYAKPDAKPSKID
jgi:flavin reductase (DIM6/NTAB) family NADH-FMN oxidoreductase RutF